MPRVAEEADRPARPGYKQVQAVDYRAKGYEVAISDRSPRGYQIVYIDTTRDLPGMMETRYAGMHLFSVGWDASDPVRRAK